MCLFATVVPAGPDRPLFVCANREELYDRPSTGPAVVDEDPGASWLGGRDLSARGTWLGLNAAGLVVAVTNRPKRTMGETLRSRGWLCRSLLGCADIEEAERNAMRQIDAFEFAGFNLLLVSRTGGVAIEAGDEVRTKRFEVGVNVVTNGDLNDPDDLRLCRAREELQDLTDIEHVDKALNRAAEICGSHAEAGRPAICLHGDGKGTVSSTLIALGPEPADVRYLFADGPPCTMNYDDHSQEAETARTKKD